MCFINDETVIRGKYSLSFRKVFHVSLTLISRYVHRPTIQVRVLSLYKKHVYVQFKMRGEIPIDRSPLSISVEPVKLQTHNGEIHEGYHGYVSHTSDIPTLNIDDISSVLVHHGMSSALIHAVCHTDGRYNINPIDGEIVTESFFTDFELLNHIDDDAFYMYSLLGLLNSVYTLTKEKLKSGV